jgi:hypothetical protein
MNDKDTRQTINPACTLGTSTGPQTIVVRQVVGEQEVQLVLDIDVVVPESKPSIEQIIDVLIKNVEINNIDVITDKVIVRGDFEIKGIYVASEPAAGVHAVEIRDYRWTQDIAIPGALRGMDADATVAVEFVDFDLYGYEGHHHGHHHNYSKRAYKYNNKIDDDDSCDNVDAYDTYDAYCCHEEKNRREFHVAVVLQIIAKVLSDREIQINPSAGTVPINPKG